jgi:hypothetical protein
MYPPVLPSERAEDWADLDVAECLAHGPGIGEVAADEGDVAPLQWGGVAPLANRGADAEVAPDSLFRQVPADEPRGTRDRTGSHGMGQQSGRRRHLPGVVPGGPDGEADAGRRGTLGGFRRK